MKLIGLAGLTLCFTAPCIGGFGRVETVVWATSVQVCILIMLYLFMKAEKATLLEVIEQKKRGNVPAEYGTWEYHAPKLLKDWDTKDKGVGPQLDTHETFGSCLFGASQASNIDNLVGGEANLE